MISCNETKRNTGTENGYGPNEMLKAGKTAMKKRSMHRIHINGDMWKWYVKGQRKNIVAFAPTGRRYEINLKDFIMSSLSYASDENGYGVEAMIDDMAYTITPEDVKSYIVDEILKYNS